VAGPEFTVLVQDDQLKTVARPVYNWQTFDATIKHNGVGSITFTAPAEPWLLNAIVPANRRVSIIRNPAPALGIAGEVLVSGPIERPGAYAWSIDSDTESGIGLVTVGAATNEAYLAERITYPNPAAAAAAQGTAYYERTAVNAETILRDLVNLNAGPGALLARRVPKLALGTVAGVGTATNVTTRFDPLTDVLRDVAEMGGGLGWRVRESGGQLLFEVYAPVTRTAARFGRSRGNLRELKTEPQAPIATVAIAGGTGEGAGRLVVERASASAGGYRRMETFVNQDGVSTTVGLEQYADKDLAEKVAKAGLSITPAEPRGGGYSRIYRPGDRVPVELATGVTHLDVVTAVRVQAEAGTPATYTPSIGTGNPTTDPVQVRAVRDMTRRLGRLERK
jgi:hypothetical protein